MRVGFNIQPKRRDILALIEALVTLNRLHLRQRRNIPHLYRSGIRYEREDIGPDGRRREEWRQIPELLKLGEGDCEDLVAYHVAWLREREGIRAIPWLTKRGSTYHVLVRYPDGRIQDPSKDLGMGQAR